MSTYKAGLLNVGTLNATGGSAQLQANTANVTTLNATTVNAQTLNVPNQASKFMVPRDQRTTIPMRGVTYENTGYFPATDACGNTLPFFNVTTQGNNNSVESNLTKFGAFEATNPIGGSIKQQTFHGVCDKDYYYQIFQINPSNPPTTWTSFNNAPWFALWGNINDWTTDVAIIVKIDRETGEFVNWVPIGLMMDMAYLAAGTTTEAQSAVGEGVYYLDSSGKPAKDSSGKYLTVPVNGLNKDASGYRGFQSRNQGITWDDAGDDNTRGPIHLFYDEVLGENVMYVPTMAMKYTSVYKIRCSDLTLVWRRTIDPEFYFYENPELTNGGRGMRQVMVIPSRPDRGRSYPIVVTGATDNLAYSAVDLQDIGKLWDYYHVGGSVQAWADYGLTASDEPIWQTEAGPDTIDASSALPLSVFRWAPLGSPMATVNGVTEVQDASGYIEDESGNVSLEIYSPLKAGYVFSNGNPAGTTKADCKTTGTFRLLTGRSHTSFQGDAYAALKADPTNPFSPDMIESVPYLMQELETANFTFGVGIFDASATYTGTILNGPFVGQSVERTGQDLLNGYPDASGRLYPQQKYGKGEFQPVTKKIYLAQAQASRPVDYDEAGQLSMYGGGVYTCLAYDVDTDVVLIPMGQMVHTGTSIDKIHTMRMLSDVSFNGVFYPGVYTPYQSRDPSGNLIYNSYLDDSNNRVITSTFYGAARPFYRGLDSNFNFYSYVPYSREFALENPTMAYSKVAIQNYYSAIAVGFGYNGDSSGFLINDIATNPKIWTPGSDSSGNVTELLQSYYCNDRLKKFWEKHNMARDSVYSGTYWNRQVTCGVMGVRADTGELVLNASTEGYDISDHSFTDFEGYSLHSPMGAFKNAGFNTDCMAPIIIRGLKDASGNSRKLLLAPSKARLVVLDFNKLIDLSGNQLTLTHIPGDDSLDYKKGILTNTWKDALLYEQLSGAPTLGASLDSYSTDANNGGSTYLHDFAAVGTKTKTGPNTSSFLTFGAPGKEVHGYDFSGGPDIFVPPTITDLQLALLSAAVQYYTFVDPNPTEAATYAAQLIGGGLTQYVDSFIIQGVNPTCCSYNLQTILNNSTSVTNASSFALAQALNTDNAVFNWIFSCEIPEDLTIVYKVAKICGPVVTVGSPNGILETLDINTGFPLNQPVPRDASGNINPQGVPGVRTANIGIYNPEGLNTPPMFVDGVFYGWGGADRWSTGPPATKFFMWTPYGK
jgi:hypothetical protein